jgi:hypothetical protein
VIQTTRNYKLQTESGRAQASEARLSRVATLMLWLIGAALLGWAIALALGIVGDRYARQLPPPKLAALEAPPARAAARPSTDASSRSNATWQFVGIADDRVYVRSGNQPMSFAAGERLPNGDLLRRIEKDAIVIASGDTESRITLFKLPAGEAAKNLTPANAAAATVSCRLNAQDRASATWIEPAIASALVREQSTFARIFPPILGAGEGGIVGGTPGGVRATGTGGTTAMFGIQDGDTLLRADGKSLTSGLAVINEVIARVQRGDSVVVEGERAGAPKRWVFAPTSCRL